MRHASARLSFGSGRSMLIWREANGRGPGARAADSSI